MTTTTWLVPLCKTNTQTHKQTPKLTNLQLFLEARGKIGSITPGVRKLFSILPDSFVPSATTEKEKLLNSNSLWYYFIKNSFYLKLDNNFALSMLCRP